MSGQLSIIVAMGRDRAIGAAGDLVFRISDDLRRFKALTMGHPIVMGRRTFESFPNGALPGRRNIVVTCNAAYSAPGAETCSSLAEAIDLARSGEGADEVFVVGGGRIYAQAMPLATRIYLTEVDADGPASTDTYFPAVDPARWRVVSRGTDTVDPRSGLTYRYICLSRI